MRLLCGGMDSVPTRALYLGHTEAAIVAVDDLRDGDVLRVEDDGYPSGSGGEGQGSEKFVVGRSAHHREAAAHGRDFRDLLRGISEVGVSPRFRPDLASAQSAAQIAAAQPSANISIMVFIRGTLFATRTGLAGVKMVSSR